MTTPQDERFDSIRTALERSAKTLDGDPASKPAPGFRARGRAALRGAATGGKTVSSSVRVSRRLAAAGTALLLFGLVAMPAFAGRGPAAGPFATVTSGIRHAVGVHPTATGDRDDVTYLGTPSATPGMAFATPDKDWHGDAVSAAAHSTPAPGQNHGQMVRQVARDNHGHGFDGSGATSTATGTATTVAEDNGGASETATATGTATNHGADVRVVAHETPAEGENHGQQVSTVARDNHGQTVSSSHATATATGTGTATATMGTGSGNGGNGNGQGNNGQGNSGQGNNGQGNNGQGNHGQGNNGHGH